MGSAGSMAGVKINAYRTLGLYYVGEKRILNSAQRDRMSGLDWTDLARNRDQRKDVVNTVINLRLLLEKFLSGYTTKGF
jgi:hypothetical protein